MGRPKKSTGTPTKERILQKAIDLFAEKSYDAVSVREITHSLGINEASLYNHYKGKKALLEAIFQRMENNLTGPGFTPIPDAVFEGEGPFPLAEFLKQGGRRFYAMVTPETGKIWRILITNQYRFTSARKGVQDYILDAPVRHFSSILETLKRKRRISPDIDCRSGGRIIAAIFFDHSVRSALKEAWIDGYQMDFEALDRDLEMVARIIEN